MPSLTNVDRASDYNRTDFLTVSSQRSHNHITASAAAAKANSEAQDQETPFKFNVFHQSSKIRAKTVLRYRRLGEVQKCRLSFKEQHGKRFR